MEIINPKYFYDYLITNEGHSNDFSLYSLKNKYPNLELEVFESGTYFHQQEISYIEEEYDWKEKKKTIGVFNYETTQLDPVSHYEHYIEIFKLQLLGFKDQEDDLEALLNDFATSISGRFNESITIDKKNYSVFFYLGDDSGTAVWQDQESINGAQMIRGTLMVLIEVSESVVSSNKIELHSEDYGEIIPYEEMTYKMENKPIEDTSTGHYDLRYTNERASRGFGFNGKYLENSFSRALFYEYLYPSNRVFRIKQINNDFKNFFAFDTMTAVSNASGNPKNNGWYEEDSEYGYKMSEDTTVKSNKTYYTRTNSGYSLTADYIINNLSFSFTFGQPVAYDVSFIPAMEEDGD